MVDIKPRFSPDINLGHLLQAAVLFVTVGGGAITSYLSLRSDIQAVRTDLTVKVSEHEVRLAYMEQTAKDIRQENKDIRQENQDFQKDMRAAIVKVTDMLGDLKMQIAGKGR